MKDFNWSEFTRRIEIKSTLSIIYNAWTIPEEIEKWFLSSGRFFDDEGKEIARNSNIEGGNKYEWNWHLFTETEYGKITQANGKDFLQFTFAGACIVDIKLSMLDEYVIVELTQKNIPTDDNSKLNIRLGCDSGWSFYLVNLKSHYENGNDLRNKNPNFKRMINN